MPREFSTQHPENLVGHLIAIGQCNTVSEISACIERLREHTSTAQDAEDRGMAKGEATLLQRQLIRKFGSLSETLEQRIRTRPTSQRHANPKKRQYQRAPDTKNPAKSRLVKIPT